jgi:hypothetical protein
MANPGLNGRSAQSPEPPARGSPRDLAIGIDASLSGDDDIVFYFFNFGFLSGERQRGRSIPLLRRRPRTGLQKFAVIETGLGHRSHFFHVGRRISRAGR